MSITITVSLDPHGPLATLVQRLREIIRLKPSFTRRAAGDEA